MKKFFEFQRFDESKDDNQFREEVLNKLEIFQNRFSSFIQASREATLIGINNADEGEKARGYKELHFKSLNNTFEKLKELGNIEELNILLDCHNQGRPEIIYVVQTLATYGRFYDICLFLKIVKENDFKKIQKIVQLASLANGNWRQWSQSLLRAINTNNSNDPFSDIDEDDLFLNSVLATTSQAGLTIKQSQEVNEKTIHSRIAIHEEKIKKLNEFKLDLKKKREENNEILRFEEEKKALDRSSISLGLPVNDGNNFDNKVNYFEFEKYAISCKSMVRISNGDDYDVCHWDDKTFRYVCYPSKKNLCTVMTTLAYDKYGNSAEVSNSQIDAMVNRMYYNSVPLLSDENSLFKIPKETFVFFKDGYYDVEEKRFVHCDTKKYFHTSCMSCDFPQSDNKPTVFLNIMKRIFVNVETKIILVYQIIGAILSNVALKFVFVFQGVSHGGKSTLAEIIAKLFCDDEIKYLGSINEINENRVSVFEKKVHLLLIGDAPNQAWSNSTVSYLKTRSRGIQINLLQNFKILLSTNYNICFKTEDGRDSSMENRIVVLPFTNNLKADQNDNQFSRISDYIRDILPEERPLIIREALEHFSDVLKNNVEFTVKFNLNESVKDDGYGKNRFKMSQNQATKGKIEKLQLIQEIIEEQFEFVDKAEFESNAKIGTLAKDVQSLINEENPDLIPRTAELGKILKSLYEKEFVSKEYSDKTYYNLKFKA